MGSTFEANCRRQGLDRLVDDKGSIGRPRWSLFSVTNQRTWVTGGSLPGSLHAPMPPEVFEHVTNPS